MPGRGGREPLWLGGFETVKPLKPLPRQFSVGSTPVFGARNAFPVLGGAGGAGGTGGALEAFRISMLSCSLLITMCEAALPTLPLALASCSPLSTFTP